VSSTTLRWHVGPDAERVAAALAEDMGGQARRALEARGAYLITIPGGSTPRRLFALLSNLDTDWSRWHVFFTDERCAPQADSDRNDAAARSVWLDRVAIPFDQIHSIPAELGADAAAVEYRRRLAGVGAFDTTLLGLGEDGHTASLFPGRPSGDDPDSPDVLAVHGAPKPPPERVTLSARRLADARSVAMLAIGAEKRVAVARLRRRESIPAAAVAPRGGVDVWLDAAASADIASPD
jgi:6-phosphogluconolactonase